MVTRRVLTEAEKEIRKIYNMTVKNMKSLEIYKKEYNMSIQRYAELAYFYKIEMQIFMNEGKELTVEHTNKAGATNEVKSPALASLEKLRADMLTLENVLGLNPAAYARINRAAAATKTMQQKKKEPSQFDKMMAQLNVPPTT